MTKMRVAIMISGRGSNMQALVHAAEAEDYPAEIICVISNRPEAAGLSFASKHGIDTVVVDHKAHPDKASFEAALLDAISERQIDLVCLAGFMRILTADFIERLGENRILNIHPSLLPSFKGLDTHRRALEAGVRFSGCTVHYVVPEMDAGPILCQAAVPVYQDDTEDRLAARILEQEHLCYPDALRMVASGRVAVSDDGKVTITDADMEDQSLWNPL